MAGGHRRYSELEKDSGKSRLENRNCSNRRTRNSAEIGQRFLLQDSWFIEPQLQATYMWLDDVSYRTTYNTLIKGEDQEGYPGNLFDSNCRSCPSGRRLCRKLPCLIQLSDSGWQGRGLKYR